VLGEANANWPAIGVLMVKDWVPLPGATLTVESTRSGESVRATEMRYDDAARGARSKKEGLCDLAIPSPFSPVSEPVVSVRDVGVGGFVEKSRVPLAIQWVPSSASMR
jgi:hypothetical protein